MSNGSVVAIWPAHLPAAVMVPLEGAAEVTLRAFGLALGEDYERVCADLGLSAVVWPLRVVAVVDIQPVLGLVVCGGKVGAS